jgi:hypothetical protein
MGALSLSAGAGEQLVALRCLVEPGRGNANAPSFKDSCLIAADIAVRASAKNPLGWGQLFKVAAPSIPDRSFATRENIGIIPELIDAAGGCVCPPN